ncbi:hypothetical protein NQ314_007537 [Rhamnusium bicolor]|uniref:Uncharacterized protein n=1 Tax=Rhamnusium bicolor TaxID=1586634 RepID=A0AAV8YMK4_9CUCU|nr:hypothetical protein NQ314_007537 [Rhamnusium bicolor]
MHMVNYEKEQNRLRSLMEEVLTDEETEDFDDDTFQDKQDVIEERQEDSETEQDIFDSEGQENVVEGPIYIGRDNITKWKKNVPKKTVCTRSENIVTRLPASKLRTRSLGTPTVILRYFINDEFIYTFSILKEIGM